MSPEQSKKQRWFRHVVKISLVVLVALLIYAMFPKRVVEVRVVEVTRGGVEEIVPSLQAGEIKSRRTASIRAVTLGRVARLTVERGQRVEEGDLFVELDNRTLRANLRLSKANLAGGESALRAATLRRNAAQKALQRSKKLASRGALASGALDRIQAEYDVAAEAVNTAQARLLQLQAQVDLALAALEETRIIAPFAGVIAQVHVETGESLVVGAPVLDLVDDAKMTVVASVDEADVGRLKAGMPVRVESDAYPENDILGKLNWIAPVVLKDVRQNRHLEVEVGLDGKGDRLKVGMSADIEIIVDKAEDTLFIPTNTIMRRGELQQVYVIEGQKARLRTIRPGLSNWERTQVLDGLREGDRVVVSLEVKGLRDDASVKIKGTPGSQRVAY